MDYFTTPLTRSELDAAIGLADRFMGKGFYTSDKLCDIMASENDFFELVKTPKGDIIGYFYCLYRKNISDDELSELCLTQIKDKISKFATVGICKSICLVEESRGNGIAEKLLKSFSDRLRDMGCEIILAPAWKKGDFIPARAHLEKCGFSLCYDMERPWFGKKGLICPYCKRESCICDAAVFIKKI